MTAAVAPAPPATVGDVLLSLGVVGARLTCAACGSAAPLGTDGWRALVWPGGGGALELCPACLPALPRLLRGRADRADALDVIGNGLTGAVLRLDVALAELAGEDLPPRARSAVALLDGLPEKLAALGPELTRLGRRVAP